MLLTIFEKNNEMNKYSVVFMPDLQTIEAVKHMKLLLAEKIGWFNSKNSLAHFTIFEFFEEVANEEIFCNQLQRIASEIKSFVVHCNSFDYFTTFDTFAFYIKPNENCFNNMQFLMKQILKEVSTVKKDKPTTTPHLSIGRGLKENQLEIAQQLFTNINLEFAVTNLTLRKFDESLKQFTVYKEFPLLGKPKEIQGSLF